MKEQLFLLQFICLFVISLFGNVNTSDKCVNKLCRGPRFTQSNCCDNYICEYSYYPATPELKICQSTEERLKIITLQDIMAAAEPKVEETTTAPREADYLDTIYTVSNRTETEASPAEFDPFDTTARQQRINELKKKKEEELKKKGKKVKKVKPAEFNPFDTKDRIKRLKEMKKKNLAEKKAKKPKVVVDKLKEQEKVERQRSQENKPSTNSNDITYVNSENVGTLKSKEVQTRSKSGWTENKQKQTYRYIFPSF